VKGPATVSNREKSPPAYLRPIRCNGDAIDEQGSSAVVEDAPMKRMGNPDDLAGIALYLASKASAFVCGAVIPVDGGFATTA
jgi:NAD(P)-dependent dehydrogenase (short-subunit alcohol dehydrogenase family)